MYTSFFMDYSEITRTISSFTMTYWHIQWEILSAICNGWWGW